MIAETFIFSNITRDYELSNGLGHYDTKTGVYVKDSIIHLDDSTIRIRKSTNE